MTDETLALQLVALKSLLAEVEQRLGRAPIAPTGLEDLKSSVDTLRTSIWAIMSAGKGARSESLVERFRVHRAVEMLEGIRADMVSGRMPLIRPEFDRLGEVIEGLQRELKRLLP